jgi:hypothetical protein
LTKLSLGNSLDVETIEPFVYLGKKEI